MRQTVHSAGTPLPCCFDGPGHLPARAAERAKNCQNLPIQEPAREPPGACSTQVAHVGRSTHDIHIRTPSALITHQRHIVRYRSEPERRTVHKPRWVHKSVLSTASRHIPAPPSVPAIYAPLPQLRLLPSPSADRALVVLLMSKVGCN